MTHRRRSERGVPGASRLLPRPAVTQPTATATDRLPDRQARAPCVPYHYAHTQWAARPSRDALECDNFACPASQRDAAATYISPVSPARRVINAPARLHLYASPGAQPKAPVDSPYRGDGTVADAGNSPSPTATLGDKAFLVRIGTRRGNCWLSRVGRTKS